MIRPRRRGPGLLGTAARTTVIAGTATRVSGNVAAQQQAKAQQAQQAAAPQAAAPEAPPAAVVEAPQAAAVPDTLGDLERLAALHQQGALTDAEFTAAKARVLGL